MHISQIFCFECDEKIAVESAGIGEIDALAVMEDETVGVTYTDPENPCLLALITIDPPTISMNFRSSWSEVIFREEKNKVLEPYEKLTVDVDEQYQGQL